MMMKTFKLIVVFFILILHHPTFSQRLTVTFTDIGKSKNFKLSKYNCNDSLSIQKSLNESLLLLYRKGFIAASFDSISYDSLNINASGVLGERYRWAKVRPDSSTSILLNDVGIKMPTLSNKSVNPRQLTRYFRLTLQQLENNGYPFARDKFNNVLIYEKTIEAQLIIDKGKRVLIDTIYLKGDAKLTNKKLAAIINLKKGEPYSESKIRKIDKRLKQQQFLSQIKPTEVEFLSHKARVYCYLNNKMASRFWGLAGFYSDKTDKKIRLNGELNLSLINSFKSGEKINFEWSAPGKGTQKLNLSTDLPYTFGWQVGVIGAFSLYRQDSTNITINPKFSFTIYTSNGGRFLLNVDYKSTSYTLNSDVSQTQYADVTAFLYGLGYEFCNFDNITLPTKGLLVKTNLNTGSRTIKQSPSSNLLEGDLFTEVYFPIHENRLIFAVRTNSKVRTIYNTKGRYTLFNNEMYKIGGMGTIRGFNQETILSSAYSVATLEFHLRMSEGLGIYIFSDKAYAKTYESGESKNNWPLGVGIGLNMVTKAGLFNLSYALGKGFGQNLGIKDAKVHFGIVAVF